MAEDRRGRRDPATASTMSTDRSFREEEGFLGRWSRRKLADQEPEPQRPDSAAPPDLRAEAPSGGRERGAETEGGPPDPAAVRPEDLPDIDSLDKDSDYTVFLKEGVPDLLKRRALRRLWLSDPVLANLDGLAEYDEDYTDAATVISGIKSIFTAGRGMRDASDEAPASELEPEPEPTPEPGTESEPDALAEAPESEPGSEPESEPGSERDAVPGIEPRSTAAEARQGGAAPVASPPVSEAPKVAALVEGNQESAVETEALAQAVAPSPRGRAAKRRWGGFEA